MATSGLAFKKIRIRSGHLHHPMYCGYRRYHLNSLYKPYWVDSCLVHGAGLHPEEETLRDLCLDGELDMAMLALAHMDHNGISPSDEGYIFLLHACQKFKAQNYAFIVHSYASQWQIQLSHRVIDCLIITLAKCGSLDDAYYLLHNLPHRTTCLWTALISGYVEHGRTQDAFDAFYSMQEKGVEPYHYIFTNLFKACGNIGRLNEGRKLHCYAWEKGLTTLPSIGATLVNMYGKCGTILEAEESFEQLGWPDVFSWNAIFLAYVEHDQEDKVMLGYRQMREEKEKPDKLTFLILLRACGSLGQEESMSEEGHSQMVFLEIGKALHADIHRNGFASDVLVCNALVIMFSKCGLIVEAVKVFESFHQRDISTWSALVATYVQHGRGAHALRAYRSMQEEGIIPDVSVFVMSIKACIILAEKEEASSIVCLEIGHAVHEDACSMGVSSDLSYGNTLLSLYGKCGSITEAENVFHGLSQHDVVSWNAMLSAYLQHCQGGKALKLYRQMLKEDVCPDVLTSISCLQACGFLGEHGNDETKAVSLELGQALHAAVRKSRLSSSVPVCNTLVSMYGKCMGLVEAENVFTSIDKADLVSWNALLSTYIESGKGGKALQLFHEMHSMSLNPSKLTYVMALQACGALAEEEGDQSCAAFALEIGRALHVDVQCKGLIGDVIVGSAILGMYGKCGAVDEAESIFHKSLPCNLVLWNAMLSSYVEHGHHDKALHLYELMELIGIMVDDITLVCALQACSEAGCLQMCGHLHFGITAAGFDVGLDLLNTVVHTYGRCGSRTDAEEAFSALSDPDQVACNVYIASCAQEGSLAGTCEGLEGMQLGSIKPDGITFLSLVYVCAHVGDVVKGMECFESMSREYNFCPNLKHYVAIIDLLGRAGDFHRIQSVILKMSFLPNMPLWVCLLHACWVHNNVALAAEAFMHALCLQANDASPFVLLSNIYADAANDLES